MSESGSGPSLYELARQVREALTRLEALASRIEANFVPNRVLELLRDNINLKFLSQEQVDRQLDRDIGNLRRDHDRDISAMQKDLESEVSGKADKSEVTALQERVRSLEDDRKWLVRLAVGAVIAALIALVVTIPGSLGR